MAGILKAQRTTAGRAHRPLFDFDKVPNEKDATSMREKLRQFMIGRYGTDGLNQFLVWCYYRTLSRNISKRTEENYRFYTLKDRVDGKFRGLKDQWANRKLYHYYRCPKCRQKLRVPRGRGRIQISCPRCGTQFIKKS